MKRSDGESWVNLHPLQYCIHSQEEEIQPEEMEVVNQRPDDPNPEIIVVLTTRNLSSVGIVERRDTSKISVGSQQRIKRRKMRQMLLPPQEEVTR